ITHLLVGAGLASAAPAATAARQSSPADVYVDVLLRRDPASAPAAGTAPAVAAPAPGQADTRVNRAEITRIILPAMRKGGNVTDPDKAYLVKVVSARTGLSQADATKLVDQTIAQAKSAADTARKSAAKFALWLVAAMLAGALSASLAAIEGGSLRNREWWTTR